MPTLKTRIQSKHDVESSWKQATGFSPLEGEIIIYDPDSNYSYPRFKVGDGTSNVNDLPFSTSYNEIVQQIESLPETVSESSPSFIQTADGKIYWKKAVEGGGSLLGEWTFNDSVATSPMYEFLVSFTSNGQNFVRMTVGNSIAPNQLSYNATTSGFNPNDVSPYNGSWQQSAYKTIQITDISSLTNVDEFTQWLTANATGGGASISYEYVAMQEVPTPTTADNGKVLGVTNGTYELQGLKQVQVSMQGGQSLGTVYAPTGTNGITIPTIAGPTGPTGAAGSDALTCSQIKSVTSIPVAGSEEKVDADSFNRTPIFGDNFIWIARGNSTLYGRTWLLYCTIKSILISPFTVSIDSVMELTGPTGSRGYTGPTGPTGATGQDGEQGVSITGATLKFDGTLSDGSIIPTPTSADNGKVLGVTNGAYALQEAGGGGGTQLYLHIILTDEDSSSMTALCVICAYSQPFTSFLDFFDKCSSNFNIAPTYPAVVACGTFKLWGSSETEYIDCSIISFLTKSFGLLVYDIQAQKTRVLTRDYLSSGVRSFLSDSVTPL